MKNETRPSAPPTSRLSHRNYVGGAKTVSPCEPAEEGRLDEMPAPEIRRALGRAFAVSDALSEAIAELDSKIQPVSRCAPPSCAQKDVEAETEIGSSVEHLVGRMELMLNAIGSMIHRVEL